MPVAEIARLAGVSERTLYKYVARGGWRRRHVGRGVEAASANRGRPWQRAPGFTQPQGAGGRFISREEAGEPQASGLKALDRQGAVRAAALCERAARLADETLAATRVRRAAEENAKTLVAMARLARAMFGRGQVSAAATKGKARDDRLRPVVGGAMQGGPLPDPPPQAGRESGRCKWRADRSNVS